MILIHKVEADSLRLTEILEELQKNSARSLESEYEALYTSITNPTLSATSRKLSKSILLWLLNAEATLSAAELIGAVGFDSGNKPIDLKPAQILYACHSLVAFDAKRKAFSFAHVSCRDFLQEKKDLTGASANVSMAARCFEVLSLGFGRYHPGDPDRELLRSHDRVLLQYARMCWPVHYSRITFEDRNKQLQESLLGFIFKGVGSGLSAAFESWNKYVVDAYDSLNMDGKPRQQLGAAVHSPHTPFFLSCAFGLPEVLSHLQRAPGFDALALQRNRAGHSGLEVAIQYGHSQIAEMLIRSGIQVNGLNVAATEELERMQQGETIGTILFASTLQAAAVSENPNMIRLLLENRVRNIHGGFYGDALQAACVAGRELNVTFMLEPHLEFPIFDVNSQGGYYGNPLQAAAFNGSVNIIEHLLKADAEIGACGGHFGYALIAAIHANNEKVVDILLKQGADPNVQSRRYGSALQVAAKVKSEYIQAQLLVTGANLAGDQPGNRHLLHHAARHDNIHMVETLLSRELDYDLELREDSEGLPRHTALQVAVSYCHVNIVRLLLDLGASWELPEDENTFVGALAVKQGGASTLETILKHIQTSKGVDSARELVNKPKAEDGHTLLQKAIEHNHVDIVRILLAYGADMTPDRESLTPLMTISRLNRHEILAIFYNQSDVWKKESGFTQALTRQNPAGEDPLWEAASRDAADVARILLSHNGCRFQPDKTGEYPLHTAVLRRSYSTLRVFFETSEDQKQRSKFDPLVRNGHGESALRLACRRGLEVVKILLENDCSFETFQPRRVGVLHLVASGNIVDVTKACLDLPPEKKARFKFDIDILNEHGKTPLIDACQRNHDTIADLLLRHGANYKIQDTDGWTALNYCGFRNYTKCVRLILDKAAANGDLQELFQIIGDFGRPVTHDLSWNICSQDSLKMLLQYGPDWRFLAPSRKATALHEAASNGQELYARWWIDYVRRVAGSKEEVLAYIDQTDIDGKTALEIARQRELVDVAKTISMLRADIAANGQ